jgi:hypothetical protein
MATEKNDPQPETTEIQWTTVSEEPEDLTKITFEIIGDQFIGKFTGPKVLTEESTGRKYTQYRFMGEDGNLYFINGRYTMREAMAKVRIGMLARVTLNGLKEVGRDSPMQIFQIDAARLAPGAPIPGPVVSEAHMLVSMADSLSEPPF